MNFINHRKKILSTVFATLVLVPQLVFAMQISTVTITGHKQAYKVEGTDTVSTLKAKIDDIDGIPPEQQKLSFNNTPLEDSKTLESYGIKEGSVVKLELKLRGG
ncbi:ubiquitin-like protein [Serratia fonticola]